MSMVLMTNTTFVNGAEMNNKAVSNLKQQNLKVVHQMSGSTNSISRLFRDMTNCTTWSLTVDINPTSASSKLDKEFDNLVLNTLDEY